MDNRYKMGIEFDTYVAEYYVRKIQQCKDRRIKFDLTLTQVKNLLRAQKCQLTNTELTHTNAGVEVKKLQQRPTDVTIDRIDSSKPYEKGNVMAVAKFANQLKGDFENTCGKNAYKMLHLMSKNLKRRGV